MKKSNQVVFFGSGPVSAESLRFIKDYFDVEAVITKPSTLQQMAKIIPETKIFSVETKNELTSLLLSQKFKSRLGIVVDFGIIIEKSAIDYFPLGIINSHFSLLPKWRGADPITFSILKGDSKTGVSLMLINKSLDTGDLIAQQSIDLPSDITTPELTAKLIALSNSMLAKYLPEYIEGKITPYAQPKDRATYSRKLKKSDSEIDWNKPAEQIERQIRAFAGWPKSRGIIGGKEVIILNAKISDQSGNPGGHQATKDSLIVYCGNKSLSIKQLQPPGKKPMPIAAYLAGYKL